MGHKVHLCEMKFTSVEISLLSRKSQLPSIILSVHQSSRARSTNNNSQLRIDRICVSLSIVHCNFTCARTRQWRSARACVRFNWESEQSVEPGNARTCVTRVNTWAALAIDIGAHLRTTSPTGSDVSHRGHPAILFIDRWLPSPTRVYNRCSECRAIEAFARALNSAGRLISPTRWS